MKNLANIWGLSTEKTGKKSDFLLNLINVGPFNKAVGPMFIHESRVSLNIVGMDILLNWSFCWSTGLYYKDFDYSKASLSALANDSLSQILPTTSFSTWMHIAEPEYDL